MSNWRNTTDPRSTTERGYGNAHIKARAAAAKVHEPTDPCVRCGHALGPMGKWLHYDHDDRDPTRTTYLGFAHAKCNVVDGARRGRARQEMPTLRW
jgi:hypothetical protein